MFLRFVAREDLRLNRDHRGEQPLQVNAHLIGFCFDQCVDPIWCHSRLMRLNRVSAVNNYEVPTHTLPSMLTYPCADGASTLSSGHWSGWHWRSSGRDADEIWSREIVADR